MNSPAPGFKDSYSNLRLIWTRFHGIIRRHKIGNFILGIVESLNVYINH